MNSHADETRGFAPYAVSLILEGLPCLVAGGGVVALRKVESLIASRAKVTIVSPEVLPEIEALEEVEIVRREFRPEDLDGRFLVISATDDKSVNETVAKAARRRSMLVNVVDDPDLSNFHVNSQVRRGELTISVSTGGASPALSRRIRGELERLYGEEYAGFLSLMREYRPLIIKEIPDQEHRKEVFEQLVRARIEEVYRERGEAAARKEIEGMIEQGARGPENMERER